MLPEDMRDLALTQSEENFRLLAENSTDLIIRVSIEGICLYVSPACVELLGYSPAELTGRNAFDFIHPLDKRAVADALEPEILFGSHRRVVCRLRRKDGYYGWFESKFQFFGDIGTKQLQIVAIARDIGDRVKKERFETVRHTIAAMNTSETDIEKEFSGLLGTICGTLTWDAGEIWLVDEPEILLRRRSAWYAPSTRLQRFGERSARMAFAPGVGLPGLLWSRGEASLVDDLPSMYSSVRRKEYEDAGLKSAIGCVLVDESKIYGVVLFMSRRRIQRNQELLDMITETGVELGDFIAKFRARESLKTESKKLGAMVEESAARIQALQSEVTRQQRLEQDIMMAAEVQRNLLPIGNPALTGFEFSSAAIPARYISGDFYDFAMPAPSLCDIVIADVSGKGIAAALMTTAARTIFRSTVAADKSPARILERMNDALYADLERSEMFLTAQLIRIDQDRGSIAYASAGHTEALHYRPSSGECIRLPSTAPPIGIMKKIDIGEMEIRIRPGDFFVIYSDGITEAADDEGELFGMERFVDILKRNEYPSAGELVHTVLAEVRAFSGDKALADDLTLIALRATSRDLRLTTASLMANLDPVAAFVRNAALPYGERIADDMELVASELVTNAITHAGSTPGRDDDGRRTGDGRRIMEIRLRLESDRIVFDLVYPGDPFDPEARERSLPGPLEEGGRGIHIVRALVDELKYSHDRVPSPESGDSNLNHWHLVKMVTQEKKA
ncbi:MAG: SpoIIE family protein phosphatase [Rectinemataceae bacterium]